MRLSLNLTLEDFRCHDPANPKLPPKASIAALRWLCLNVIEPMIIEYGEVTVESGYRTFFWNRKVGGARLSRHLYGLFRRSPAVDLRFKYGRPDLWRRRARELLGPTRGGTGIYPGKTTLHVDRRLRRADW